MLRFLNGKQPQIKVSDLYKIPVILNYYTQKEIAVLVDEIYNNGDKNKAINKINKIIYDFFEIDKNDINIIKKSIKDF